MCNPAAVMMAVQIGQTVMSHRAESSAAKAQEQQIRQSAEMQNIQSAKVMQEQTQQASEQTSQRHIEWLRDLGRLRAVGAESGVFGATQDRIEQEATNLANADIATIESNRMKATQQTATNAKAQEMEANAQLKSIKRPSVLGTALQIGGHYAEYKTKPGPSTPTTART